MAAFPWGVAGTELAAEPGPDENQIEFLEDLGDQVIERGFLGQEPVMPILMSATSGHGTGKSVMGAWLACWILSTRPDSIGTVTAGTWPQLESRTWAQIQHWLKLCETAEWFVIQSDKIFHKRRPKTWKIVAQTCREENAQSFAGQHARTSSSWYLFDEASQVPDKVWDVAKGGLSDGQPFWFAWGQCERSEGRFYEINFGKQEMRWNHRCFDSRDSRLTNKELIQADIDDYGLDSDFVRVRILGLYPKRSGLQFIEHERITAAQQRKAVTFADEPLIAGFDASGGGAAWNVVRFRRGLDGNPKPPLRIPGDQSRDREFLLGKLAEIMRDERPGHKVTVMFVDSAFGSPYVERLHVLGFRNVIEVNFGSASPDPHQYNMRAYMWNLCREWLTRGSLPPDDKKLASDLNGPGSKIMLRTSQLVIESKDDMKKRGLASPDDADALCLTFAAPIAPQEKEEPQDEDDEFAHDGRYSRQGGWMR